MIDSQVWPTKADKVWGIGIMNNFWVGFEKRALMSSRMGELASGAALNAIPFGTTVNTAVGERPEGHNRAAEWVGRQGGLAGGAITGAVLAGMAYGALRGKKIYKQMKSVGRDAFSHMDEEDAMDAYRTAKDLSERALKNHAIAGGATAVGGGVLGAVAGEGMGHDMAVKKYYKDKRPSQVKDEYQG